MFLLFIVAGVTAAPGRAHAADTRATLVFDLGEASTAGAVHTRLTTLATQHGGLDRAARATLGHGWYADIAPEFQYTDFDTELSVSGSLLTVVVKQPEVSGNWNWNWLLDSLITITGTIVGELATTGCLVYLPGLVPVCTGLGGFLGEAVSGLLTKWKEGGDSETGYLDIFAKSLTIGIATALVGWAAPDQAVALLKAINAKAVKVVRTIGSYFSTGGIADKLAAVLGRSVETLPQRMNQLGSASTAYCRGASEQTWTEVGAVANHPAGLQSRFVYLDDNGVTDRVIISEGRVYAWRNLGCDRGSGEMLWQPLGDVAPSAGVGLTTTLSDAYFGDLDGDDRDDYIRIAFTNGVASMMVWRNESSGDQVRWAAPKTVANNLGYENIQFADLDGDGDDDLITLDRMSFATLWENKAGALPSPGDWSKVAGFGYPASGRQGVTYFADVTGDRRADIVLVEYHTGDVAAWENTGRPWTLTKGWKSLGTIREGEVFPGSAGSFAEITPNTGSMFLVLDETSGVVRAWALPRYGSGDSGPGQEHGGGVPDLPAGTLPAYSGGQPSPQVDGRLLQNSNFTGSFKPWWVNAGMVPSVNGGVFCVTAPAAANPWDVIVGHNSIYLPGNSTFTLKFRARTSVAANPLVQLAPFDNPGKITYLNKGLTTGTGWKNFSYEIKTTYPDKYVLSQLQFRLGGATKAYEFCMDDVTLNGNEYAYQASRGPSIKVNQHGYLPRGPKRATVVTSATSGLSWQLRPVGGAVAMSGTTRPGGFDGSAGAPVHTLDFSGVTTPGTYYLVVNGESSNTFAISASIYDRLQTDSMRFFYTNRSGIAINDGAYSRPAGHVAGTPGEGDTAVPCQSPKSYVDNWTCDYKLNVTGGWYDAGDHGKYVVNGGIATYQLLNSWERDKKQWADGTLRIPESGNGVPDILDEARWNLEFMLKMQVPDGKPLAGMVHHKVHDESWTGPPTLPHQDRKQRELHRPSTAATLNLAAVAAQGARIFQTYDAAFASRLRATAVKAYSAAKANPALYAPRADRSGGGPYNDDDVSDEFYWAAVELFLTTTSTAYRSDFLASRHHRAGAAFSQNGFYWGSVAALGQMDLARFSPVAADSQVRAWVTAAADKLISFQKAEKFGQTYTPSTGKYDWGSNASILNNQVVLATAYDLTGAAGYADAVFEGFDYLLGRNALGQSYITGYGTNQAKNQHSRWYAKSLDSTLPNPPAGSIAGGPNSSLQDPLSAAWLNDCAPQLCYVDNIEAWSVNEITINWNSALAWVTAFAADAATRR